LVDLNKELVGGFSNSPGESPFDRLIAVGGRSHQNRSQG